MLFTKLSISVNLSMPTVKIVAIIDIKIVINNIKITLVI